MPFGGSIPRRSKISGWRSGSSIISRTFCIVSFRPPTSSYVMFGTFLISLIGSLLILTSVSSFIMTGPCGNTCATTSGIDVPNMPTGSRLPLRTALPISLFLTYWSNPTE